MSLLNHNTYFYAITPVLNFGVTQAFEIDSLRIVIEKYRNTSLFAPLMAALYYAMKECVFAKDGHMAQPLGFKKNTTKLLKQRQKSIFALFNAKFMEFFSDDFVVSAYGNECFNINFEDLLKLPKIREETLLEMRYMNFMAWEDVADSLGLTLRSIFNLHDKALAEIEKIRRT